MERTIITPEQPKDTAYKHIVALASVALPEFYAAPETVRQELPTFVTDAVHDAEDYLTDASELSETGAIEIVHGLMDAQNALEAA